MSEIFLTRAAQSVYHKGGFPSDEAYRRGEMVARYLLDNFEMVQKLYHIDDEFELAYRLAQATMAYELGATES